MDQEPIIASKPDWSGRRHQKAFKKIANYLKIQALLNEIAEQESLLNPDLRSMKRADAEEI
jgi:hypothetical protein